MYYDILDSAHLAIASNLANDSRYESLSVGPHILLATLDFPSLIDCAFLCDTYKCE
jgi:hypothetical protein